MAIFQENQELDCCRSWEGGVVSHEMSASATEHSLVRSCDKQVSMWKLTGLLTIDGYLHRNTCPFLATLHGWKLQSLQTVPPIGDWHEGRQKTWSELDLSRRSTSTYLGGSSSWWRWNPFIKVVVHRGCQRTWNSMTVFNQATMTVSWLPLVYSFTCSGTTFGDKWRRIHGLNVLHLTQPTKSQNCRKSWTSGHENIAAMLCSLCI